MSLFINNAAAIRTRMEGILKEQPSNDVESIIKRNLEGRKLEKMGFTKDAVELYEKNVEVGDVETESYRRLVSIYRDHNDYENEKRVIQSYLQLWEGLNADHPASVAAIETFEERLSEVIRIQEKNPNQTARPVSNEVH